MDCAICKLCFGRHEIAHAGIRNFRRTKFEKDSNSLTHQQLDSRKRRQKWAEEGCKRNDYRLSLPSFSFCSRLPPFSHALHFRVFPTIWEPGTGYSNAILFHILSPPIALSSLSSQISVVMEGVSSIEPFNGLYNGLHAPACEVSPSPCANVVLPSIAIFDRSTLSR